MKITTLLLLLTFCFQSTYSQIFEIQTIKNSGDVDKRINFVILSEGYQESEFPQFEIDANNFINDMFDAEPFASYENYFNVHIIKVPSNESGASHPGTAFDEGDYNVPTQMVDTYFGASYDNANFHRALAINNSFLVSQVLALNFPTYDQAIILVNSPYYGGTGGQFAIASTGTDSSEIAIHEIGHSFADLKDEYYPGVIYMAEAINMTQETNPALIKWKNWLGIDNVGIFENNASEATPSSWYRPHQTCKMRYLGFDFCAVCKEGIIEKIHDLISPIDSFTPTETEINQVTFPLDFQLNTIQTLPTNTLEYNWTLNGNTFGSNSDTVTIQEGELTTGLNSLSVVVQDTSPLIKVDNHASIHISTVTWSIDNVLGLQDVTTNDLSVIMYPNPSNNFINIKLENFLNRDGHVDITNMDGKTINTIPLLSSQNTEIDISDLGDGIYITHFYVSDILVASKKLIKN